jgi:hypothetical protein
LEQQKQPSVIAYPKATFCHCILKQSLNKKQAFINHEYRIEENALDFMEMIEAYCKDQLTAGDWMLPDNDKSKILALQVEKGQMIKGFKNS